MTLHEYLRKIKKLFDSGISTEHSYRGDLQSLLNSLFKNIKVTNEPKRQKCGAPDYILQRKDVPIGYIEAKDIGFDLDKAEKSAQIKRYLRSLDNLILTDYLEFRFYRYKEKIKTIKIGSIEKGKIQALPHHFSDFESHLKDFCTFRSHTIKSAKDLAEVMAGKARMLEEVIYRLLQDRGDEDNDLVGQFKAFRKILLHDLDEKAFADVYAQTIAYGLFAARLHDKPLNDFDRQKASGLIPPSNPFLRKLFDYISGVQLDSRMVWVVDDLCQIFRATNLNTILANFGLTFSQTNAGEDPFIYFYETFLAEYNPKLRKSRGVYYTPEPVVGFIVRAVDDILKTEFALPKGLADTTKTSILQRTDMEDGKKIAVYKVQILDPATGTGTFLAETIKQIHSKFKGQEGLWSSYVEEHLLPRVNGFEVLMASYTMCHLKMEMLLGQTGYRAKEKNKQKRLNVFLTNSLAEVHENTETLFTSWLSKEATEANKVKRDTPIMCVLGNPPYSGESQNKGKWISELMEDYKKEPGGQVKLEERNPKWINDDYVKFLRYGQHFIEKNGSGILAFINNNGFLDNPTFRGMRWHLLKTYDNIYIIDLHGNSKKKEVAPDGSKDENVFDIMQGVSINIFVKTGQKKTGALAKVFHYDLYGRREDKYKFLLDNGIASVPYVELPNEKPNYFFVQKDFKKKKNYDKGFSVKELFPLNSVGIVTGKDSFYIDYYKKDLISKIEGHHSPIDKNLIRDISYRPFDIRYLYNNIKLIERNRFRVMKHFIKGENLGLVFNRPAQGGADYFTDVYITKNITDQSIFFSDKAISIYCPSLPLP